MEQLGCLTLTGCLPLSYHCRSYSFFVPLGTSTYTICILAQAFHKQQQSPTRAAVVDSSCSSLLTSQTRYCSRPQRGLINHHGSVSPPRTSLYPPSLCCMSFRCVMRLGNIPLLFASPFPFTLAIYSVPLPHSHTRLNSSQNSSFRCTTSDIDCAYSRYRRYIPPGKLCFGSFLWRMACEPTTSDRKALRLTSCPTLGYVFLSPSIIWHAQT